jgi:hypothetical protein
MSVGPLENYNIFFYDNPRGAIYKVKKTAI